MWLFQTSGLTLTQLSVIVGVVVGVFTIIGLLAALVRFVYRLGSRFGTFETTVLDKFDRLGQELTNNKKMIDKATTDLAEHCDDENLHVNTKLESFKEETNRTWRKGVDDKLNLLLNR